MFERGAKRLNLRKAIRKKTANKILPKIGLFERLIAVSTLGLSLAAIIISVNQTRLQNHAINMEKARLRPNILARSEYFPIRSPDQILNNPSILTDHKVELFGNLAFVRELRVEHQAALEVAATSNHSFELVRIRAPISGYFWFCDVRLEPDKSNFATCIGEDNLKNSTRISSELFNHEADNFRIENAEIRHIFKVSYTTLLGAEVTSFVSINNQGVSKGPSLEKYFLEATNVGTRSFLSMRSTTSEILNVIAPTIMEAFSTVERL